MRITIAGAGSIGTVLGVLLKQTEADIRLLRRSGPKGLLDITITGEVNQTEEMNIIHHDDKLINPADLIIITVQEQHTSEIVEQLIDSNMVGNDTILISLQNGVNAAKTLVSSFPDHPVLAGTVWWSATLANYNTVLYHRKASTVIGIPNGSKAKKSHLGKVVRLLKKVLTVEQTGDILNEQRRKLVLNVVSPPLALAKLPYPQGLKDDNIRQVVHALFDEAIETASLLDWQIDEQDDQRLSQFHDLLISGDIPADNKSRTIQHKVSTQIGMEKYGGEGSNIYELLGWLQLSGSQLADEIISLTLKQPPSYEAVDTSLLLQITEMNQSARCPRIPFDTS